MRIQTGDNKRSGDAHTLEIVAGAGEDTVQVAVDGHVKVTVPASGGGSQPGAIRLYKIPFAFDSADIADPGFSVYTPTVGDILFDAWIDVVTAWNGTTPLGTILTQNIPGTGYDYVTYAQCDMTSVGYTSAGVLAGGGTGGQGGTDAIASGAVTAGLGGLRQVPARVLAATPIVVVVTQDGFPGSAPAGASQGTGFVYLAVSTPSTPTP